MELSVFAAAELTVPELPRTMAPGPLMTLAAESA